MKDLIHDILIYASYGLLLSVAGIGISDRMFTIFIASLVLGKLSIILVELRKD